MRATRPAFHVYVTVLWDVAQCSVVGGCQETSSESVWRVYIIAARNTLEKEMLFYKAG